MSAINEGDWVIVKDWKYRPLLVHKVTAKRVFAHPKNDGYIQHIRPEKVLFVGTEETASELAGMLNVEKDAFDLQHKNAVLAHQIAINAILKKATGEA